MKNVYTLILTIFLTGCVLTRPTDPYIRDEAPISVPVKPPVQYDKALTLERAIEIALTNNPDILSRHWETEAALARYNQTFGEGLPRLSVAGSYTHYLDPQRILPVGQPGDPAILSRDISSAELILTVPIFSGGRLIRQIKAADLLRQAASHQLARSREELIFNVTSLFYNIRSRYHVMESLTFSEKTLTEHLNRMQALIESEKAANVDKMRMEVRLADVKQKQVQEKNLLSIQKRALANILGLEDQVLEIHQEKVLLPPDKIVDTPDLDSALTYALKERGDYLATRSSLEARAGLVDAARAASWPQISLRSSYGGRMATGPVSGTGDKQGDIGSVGLSLEIPLFQGWQISAAVREQKAKLYAEQEQLRKLELQIRLDVETAHSNIRSLAERLEAIQTSISQAKESHRIEQEKYILGKGTIVDVLDAQTALLETETTYYQLLAEYHTARAQLKMAMGEE